MKRVFTVMLIAVACVVGSTPTFALGGVVHLLARGQVGQGFGGGVAHDPTTLLGPSSTPAFEDRIPAPLPAPTQPPRYQRPVGAEPIRRRYVAASAPRSVQRCTLRGAVRGHLQIRGVVRPRRQLVPVGPERLALAALGNTHVERDPIQYAFRDGLAGRGGRIRTSAFQNRNSRRLSARGGRIRTYASQLKFGLAG
jgi:hypothetical protein